MNVLYLYNATQTYTNTVYEHLAAFSNHSKHHSFFCHQDPQRGIHVDLNRFDAAIVHYSIRLPFDQIAETTAAALADYRGLKALFIQDEYDHTYRAWHWIKRLGIQLVFTVVPDAGIARVYPPAEFPGVRFVSCLTGYAPDDLQGPSPVPPSRRGLMLGYRGRRLPIRYGQLGQEKMAVGSLVKQYCESHGVPHDIAWTEDQRIYGSQWYEFMASCRAMLGSESGSNVFDWDGTLAGDVVRFTREHREATDDDVYAALISSREIPGLMNQVSPRIFEAIACRTALVLFEGTYSGVVQPDVHFIPLKKDGGNLDQVIERLGDGDCVDRMTERAYHDVIASGRYSYRAFVVMVDEEVERSVGSLRRRSPVGDTVAGDDDTATPDTRTAVASPSLLSTSPIRAVVPVVPASIGLARRLSLYLWLKLPIGVRARLKKLLGRA